MRGVKAKRLRRLVYGETNPRVREDVHTNQRLVYMTGEKRNWFSHKLEKAWGWPILFYTLRADSKRWAYQKAKKDLKWLNTLLSRLPLSGGSMPRKQLSPSTPVPLPSA